jgi:hypothetical protein
MVSQLSDIWQTFVPLDNPFDLLRPRIAVRDLLHGEIWPDAGNLFVKLGDEISTGTEALQTQIPIALREIRSGYLANEVIEESAVSVFHDPDGDPVAVFDGRPCQRHRVLFECRQPLRMIEQPLHARHPGAQITVRRPRIAELRGAQQVGSECVKRLLIESGA